MTGFHSLIRRFRPFIHGFAGAVVALVIADRFFRVDRVMAACALIALSAYPLLNELLEDNRRAIWDEKRSAWVANRQFALALIQFFVGVFLAGILCEQGGFITSIIHRASSSFQNELVPLFRHNFTVLGVCVLLALLYRAAGLVLILSWNALHWASLLATQVHTMHETRGGAVLFAGAVLPHLIFEVLAYSLAGMCGIFISKALSKYGLDSSALQRVAWASFLILVISIVLLAIAALCEIYCAQPIISAANQR